MYFRDSLDSFVIILLDNSIIFFGGHEPTWADCKISPRVFELSQTICQIREAKFWKVSTEFLGSLTSPEAMEMNPEKSRAWPRQRQLLGSSVLLASLTFITN